MLIIAASSFAKQGAPGSPWAALSTMSNSSPHVAEADSGVRLPLDEDKETTYLAETVLTFRNGVLRCCVIVIMIFALACRHVIASRALLVPARFEGLARFEVSTVRGCAVACHWPCFVFLLCFATIIRGCAVACHWLCVVFLLYRVRVVARCSLRSRVIVVMNSDQ